MTAYMGVVESTVCGVRTSLAEGVRQRPARKPARLRAPRPGPRTSGTASTAPRGGPRTRSSSSSPRDRGRDPDHLRLGLVLHQLVPELTQDRLAVAREEHVDEVDDDDPTDVAQSKLPDDLGRRFEV